jgi:hypothetical protein
MDSIAVSVKHRRCGFSGVRGQFVVMVFRRGVDELGRLVSAMLGSAPSWDEVGTATFMVGQVYRRIGEPDPNPSRKSFRCSLFAAGGFLP